VRVRKEEEEKEEFRQAGVRSSLAYYNESTILKIHTYRMMDERPWCKFIGIAVRRHIFHHRATVCVLDGRRRPTLVVWVSLVEKVVLLCVTAGLLLQQPVRLVVIVVVIAVVRRCRHLGTGLVSVNESLMKLGRRTFQDFALFRYRRLWVCCWWILFF
jgi:hypothetical protein